MENQVEAGKEFTTKAKEVSKKLIEDFDIKEGSNYGLILVALQKTEDVEDGFMANFSVTVEGSRDYMFHMLRNLAANPEVNQLMIQAIMANE